MTGMTLNKVLAVLQKAQLFNRGSLPVKVLVGNAEHVVVAARFNENSGNVELTIKG